MSNSPDTIHISPIETVTVEASPLMDWPKFLLIAALAFGLWSLLEGAEKDVL